MTGALDEVMIQQILDEEKRMKEMAERKASIEKSITEQGKMTDKSCSSSWMPPKTCRSWKIFTCLINQNVKPGPMRHVSRVTAACRHPVVAGQQVPEKEAMAFINDKVLTAEDALQGARISLPKRSMKTRWYVKKMRSCSASGP